MRNEHDQNQVDPPRLVVLEGRGENCDVDNDERSSRAVMGPPAVSQGPRDEKHRTPSGEQLFSDDEIWRQLESAIPERRRCAVAAIDAVARLAGVRARKFGTSFLFERTLVFDTGLLDADIGCDDSELATAALDAWDDVSHLAACVAAESYEITDEDRKWSEQLQAHIKTRLAELRKQLEATSRS